MRDIRSGFQVLVKFVWHEEDLPVIGYAAGSEANRAFSSGQ
jgi:hypothetical protein